jgi:hypothetical protein
LSARFRNQLAAGGNLGLWNQFMEATHGAGGRLGSIWSGAKAMQGRNINRLGTLRDTAMAWLDVARMPSSGAAPGGMGGRSLIDRYHALGHFLVSEPASVGRLPARLRLARMKAGSGVSGLMNLMGSGVTGGLAKLKSVGSSAFTALKTGVLGFGAGLKATALFFVTNPIGLAILAIVAAVGLLIWKWDAVTAAVKGAATWIKSVLTRIPILGTVFSKLFAGIADGWKIIRDGFAKYVQPLLDKLGMALKWVGDKLGLTQNSYENSLGNPLNGMHFQRDAKGMPSFQSALGNLNTLNAWLTKNSANFQAGVLTQDNERLYRSVYLYAKRLDKWLPDIAKANGIATAALNIPGVAPLDDKVMAHMKEVDADAAQEAADAATMRGDAPTSGPARSLVAPIAAAVETGAARGTAKGLQDAMARPGWSGDKWLVNGHSPFAGLEAKYMDRAMTNRVGTQASENRDTELAELRGHMARVSDGLHELAKKQTAVHLMVDGKKLASGLIGHFGNLTHRTSVRGVGGQE